MAATVGALVVCLRVLGNGDSPPSTLLLGLPLVIVIGKVLGLYERDELVMRKSILDEAPGLFQVATSSAWCCGSVRRPCV